MAKTPKRIDVSATCAIDWAGNLTGNTLKQAADYIAKLAEDLPKEFPSAYGFKLDGEVYGYNGGVEYYIRYMRPETDEEMQTRLRQDEKTKKKRKADADALRAKELDQLKELLKKYPNEVTK